MLKLTASARCLRCEWTAESDPEPVDKQAEKHAKVHPTATEMRPVR